MEHDVYVILEIGLNELLRDIKIRLDYVAVDGAQTLAEVRLSFSYFVEDLESFQFQ